MEQNSDRCDSFLIVNSEVDPISLKKLDAELNSSLLPCDTPSQPDCVVHFNHTDNNMLFLPNIYIMRSNQLPLLPLLEFVHHILESFHGIVHVRMELVSAPPFNSLLESNEIRRKPNISLQQRGIPVACVS